MAIRKHPPMSPDDIANLVSEIENDNNPHIDGKILSSLIELTFHCALKKKELINLCIGNVVDDNGNIRDLIQRTKGPVHLSDEAKQVIQETLVHLAKVDSYRTDLDSPLFPDRDGTKYSDRKLSRHLRICAGEGSKVILEKIRQAGIYKYYESLESELTDEERLEKTAKFAGVSLKQAMGILTGKIQPSGGKKEHLGEIPIDLMGFDDLMQLLEKDQLTEKEFLAILFRIEYLHEFDFDALKTLQDAYLGAVFRNKALPEEEKKTWKIAISQAISTLGYDFNNGQ